MSADYYIRLEQGRDRHPSDQIVAALARVFSLDDDGAAHLRELARPAPRRTRAARRPERVTPSLLRLMRTWSDTPALVLGRHMEVLAATPLAVAQYFSGLAEDRRGDRGRAAGQHGHRPRRPAPDGTGRRAVIEERGLPPPVGQARSPRENRRAEAIHPSAGGRARAVLRDVHGQRGAGAPGQTLVV